jgi:hypothetical protein
MLTMMQLSNGMHRIRLARFQTMIGLGSGIIIFWLLAVCPLQSYCQRFDSAIQTVNKKRLRTVVVASSTAYVASMVGLNSLWYSQTPRESFHFFNDLREWQYMDKAGHFYSAFHLSAIGASSLRWCSVPAKKSGVIGSLAAFGILASIEVMDGFSSSYGASASDLAANALGSVFYIGQNLMWKDVRIYPKFSFHQTSFAAARPEVLGKNLPQQLFKDYNGQTYWLSVDVDKFCPFPAWLNLAVGYGATGMISARNDNTSAYTPGRQFYLGLDLDLTAIQTRSKALKTVLFFANMIRIPFPALEFSKNGTKAYALYF